jgi:hypothetical protein
MNEANKKEKERLNIYWDGYDQGRFDMLMSLDILYGHKFLDKFNKDADKDIGIKIFKRKYKKDKK